MLFLYGELMVLLLVSFAFGAAVAAVLVRLLVEEQGPDGEAAGERTAPTTVAGSVGERDWS